MRKTLKIGKPEWVSKPMLQKILSVINKNPTWWLQEDAGYKYKYINIRLDSRTMLAYITSGEGDGGIIGVIND